MLCSLLCIFVSMDAHANRIDSLQTDADVITFLKSINKDFNSSNFELRSTETLRKDLDCNGMAEKWQIQSWDKVDFNNDKLTDLVIMPFWYDYGVYVIMDKGNNKFETLTLTYNINEKCEMVKPFTLKNEQGLLYFLQRSKLKTRTDTLVYRHGNFVEYNADPASYQIDSISYRTGYCFGSCPVFKISTDSKGNAVFEAGAYNPKMGTFTTTLKPELVRDLIDLVNYVEPLQLNDDYKVSWTDDQTAWLRIRFTDGSVKEIKDYGLKGTFGLRHIYSKFSELRSTQSWK